jgi:hypothetical protein
MTEAQNLLSSMIDAIQADVRGASEVQGKLSELAAKIDASHKSMATIQKVHRAMCVTPQRAEKKDRVSQ